MGYRNCCVYYYYYYYYWNFAHNVIKYISKYHEICCVLNLVTHYNLLIC